MELWGGVECTVNRTADGYRDQIRLSGHHARLSDLDLFADLGIRALRQPILWERTMPEQDGAPDWRWPDERLHRLRALGMRPIAGLVHHGSGPRHTHLLDPGFAAGLGHYAGQVAARYPWIDEWTPVNEPLTTARFSALYGHWYPHRRDLRSFWLALLNQVDATRAAMRAIRAVNPAARLVATDDLGRSYATAPLAEQAAYDNARRWAGWDLLFGRVTTHDPVGEELERLGLGDRLRRIADDPCPPDMIGVNHYLTSDRFLDDRLERYPEHLHGGNEHLRYADTEAVRVLDPAPDGLRVALSEAWARYRTPIAITEVHLGCTREEQLRWAAAAWDTATDLRRSGVDVRAVTAWSLLGSHGWNTLLTDDGAYETGVFDTGSGTPRPTALASLWRALPRGEARHPVATQPGWWQRPERLLYPPHPSDIDPRRREAPSSPRPLLIRGAETTVGQLFVEACDRRAIAYVAVGDDDTPQRYAQDYASTSGAWALVDARIVTPATDADITCFGGDIVLARDETVDALTCPALLSARRDGDAAKTRCVAMNAMSRTQALARVDEASLTYGDTAATTQHEPHAGASLRMWIDDLLDRLIDGEGNI